VGAHSNGGLIIICGFQRLHLVSSTVSSCHHLSPAFSQISSYCDLNFRYFVEFSHNLFVFFVVFTKMEITVIFPFVLSHNHPKQLTYKVNNDFFEQISLN